MGLTSTRHHKPGTPQRLTRPIYVPLQVPAAQTARTRVRHRHKERRDARHYHGTADRARQATKARGAAEVELGRLFSGSLPKRPVATGSAPLRRRIVRSPFLRVQAAALVAKGFWESVGEAPAHPESLYLGRRSAEQHLREKRLVSCLSCSCSSRDRNELSRDFRSPPQAFVSIRGPTLPGPLVV